ncbi:MAG: NUDIX hydrolase [Actinomycetota bacterium]|nr:NUDIX hydrolase [Actinomycetota bacterium]
MGAGCLLFDDRHRLLIVNPTYKPRWSIPGGGVDVGESPRQACRRELQEELGIEVDPGRLICVDYLAPTDTSAENIQFLFNGGMLAAPLVDEIVLCHEELSEWRLLHLDRAIPLLRPRLARRVRSVVPVLDGDRCLYLEDGKVVY